MLARSTRVLLVALIGLALAYLAVPGEPLHGCIGATTMVANVLFIAFAAIDFARRRARDRAEG